MKKLILTFILIFSLSFLCGCNNQEEVNVDKNFIMLSIQQNADGSAKQSVVFGVNSDFLRLHSKSVQEELIFKQNLVKQVEEIRKEFLFSFALTYMKKPVEEYKINQGVLLSQVGYNAEGDYVGFEVTFTSLGAWRYYHQINENTQEAKGGGNIFYLKQVSEGEFPFSTLLGGKTSIGEKYKNCYISACQGLSFESVIKYQYKPDYVYNYATYYSRFHSNADAKFRGNDLKYHHVWIENDLNSCDNIKLSTYVIYKGWWILCVLVVALGAMAISIAYVKIKEKRKLKN